METTARPSKADHDCGYCGRRLTDDSAAIERFGERFCSGSHADEFAAGVRAHRIEAAAARDGGACAFAASGRPTWRQYMKRGICWAGPLLLLLAIPLFWTGGATTAAGGSLLSVLALVACPIGMYFMMRAMGGMDHGPGHRAEDNPNTEKKT